jgi:predicted PurR-regulated permease PerM
MSTREPDGAARASGATGIADERPRLVASRRPDAPRTAAAPATTAPRDAGGPLAPAWLRASSEWTWRLLLVGFGIVALVYALGFLRVIVLPVIVALLLTTLLLPPKRWLTQRGLGDGAATALTLVGALVALGLLGTAIAPTIGGQMDELRTGIEDGVREATGILAERPFNLSRADLDAQVDTALDRLRENSGTVTRGVTEGVVLLGEVLTGLIVVVLLTFFFLKDGTGIWSWLVGLFAGHHARAADEVGSRIFATLSGYMRGIALVGLVDAVLIGIALLVIGVPLVVPLMLLTFLAAFLPLVGAFLAGLAAVLIALVFNGYVAALLVLAVIFVVQQVEGHLLYPMLMSRTVHLHPAVVVVALAAGGIVAGIIGVFLAVPVAGVISTVLSYVRDQPPPEPPLAATEAEAVPG